MKTPPSHFRRFLRAFCLAALSVPLAWGQGDSPPTKEFDGPKLPEFNFTAHGQGNLSQLCRELEAKADPRTHIYVSEAAGKFRVPDLAFKNVTVADVLFGLEKSRTPKIKCLQRPDVNNVGHYTAFNYWLSPAVPLSAFVCHLYRLPDLPLEAGGGAADVEKRKLALNALAATIENEAYRTIEFWHDTSRHLTQETWPSAALIMEYHADTRVVIAISSSENLEVLSLIVKTMGGEDIGSVQPPASALAEDVIARPNGVSNVGLPPVAPLIAEPADPSHLTDFIQIPPGSTGLSKQGTVAPEAKPAQK